MTRKNTKDYSTITLTKKIIKKLKKYKIHKNQAIEEVIKKFLNNQNKTNKQKQ